MRKYIIKITRGPDKGRFFKAPFKGTTDKRYQAYHYNEDELKRHDHVYGDLASKYLVLIPVGKLC